MARANTALPGKRVNPSPERERGRGEGAGRGTDDAGAGSAGDCMTPHPDGWRRLDLSLRERWRASSAGASGPRTMALSKSKERDAGDQLI